MPHRTSVFLHRPTGCRIKDNVAHVLIDGLPSGFTMSTENLRESAVRSLRALSRHARGDRDVVEGD